MTALQFRAKDLDNFYKTAVGFDSLFDRLFNDLPISKDTGFPPYNIAKQDEENYTIEMAVAGFDKTELDIEVRDGMLEVKGRAVDADENQEIQTTKYLHRGIAKRNFYRKFSLSDDVIVGSADLVNGLLVINLKRIVPEEKRPRKIEIGSAAMLEDVGKQELLNE